jgi:hypothetical protein
MKWTFSTAQWCGRETWCLALMEEQILGVWEQVTQENIRTQQREYRIRKLHNNEFHNLYFALDKIRAMESRRIR